MHTEHNSADKEVHFMKVEAEVEKFELGLRAIGELFQRMKSKDFGAGDFREWTIVDFDNCLKGNPHV